MKKILKKIVLNILKIEARLVLYKYKPKIIAITGSVGKTSSKDAIYTALSQFLFVRKSMKSYNSEFGVPLTILGCETGWNNIFSWISNILEGLKLIILKNHYPKWLILEVGADRPGDIKNITKWLKPDIVVITRFGDVPVHIEFFNSPDEVIKEKSYLISALKKDGLLVLNNDDENVIHLKEKWDGKVITYGFNELADVLASNEEVIYENGFPSGVMFRVDFDGSSVPVRLYGSMGKQHIYAALIAITVGNGLKLNMVRMAQAMQSHIGAMGRMKIIDGIKSTLIIDDSYNASPVATEVALSTIQDINMQANGRRIAILGDMLELGKYSIEEHKRIGKIAGGVVDMILVVGHNSKYISEGALLGGLSEKDIIEFPDSKSAGKYMEMNLREGDIVLVKGSQGMRMERAILEIMAHPEIKDELLVRQEKEWKVR